MSKDLDLNPVIVSSNVAIAKDTYVLGFKKHCSYKAGQVLHLTLNSSIDPRIYSICSGENEQEIKILYKYVSTGTLTPKLKLLLPGDTVLVSHASGSFTFNQKKGVCIATGTGIAPFISMLRSGITNLSIIHGARYIDELYFKDELLKLGEQNYMACITSEKINGIFKGRVTDYIHTIELNASLDYYLCGSAEMVVDVRDILIAKKVPFQNIYAEIYF